MVGLYAWLPLWCLSDGEDGFGGVGVNLECLYGVVERRGELLWAYFDCAAYVGVQGVVAGEGGEAQGGP